MNVFGIVNATESKNEVLCYSETLGDKTSNEISSMLFEYLQSYAFKNIHLVLYQDNTCSQNKNQFMVAFMQFLVVSGRFASVRAKFLVVGYTHFWPDRVFAWMSTIIKFEDLYTVNCILQACKDSKVKAKTVAFFQNWRDFLDEFHLKKLDKISTLAEICVVKEDPKSIYCTKKFTPSSIVPNLLLYEEKKKFWKKGCPDVNDVEKLPVKDLEGLSSSSFFFGLSSLRVEVFLFKSFSSSVQFLFTSFLQFST